MYSSTDYDQDHIQLDSDTPDTFSRSFRATPGEIIGISDIFENPESPRLDRRDRRAILEARHNLKEFINRHDDKPYAFWEVFKAAYGDSSYTKSKGFNGLTKDAWTEEIRWQREVTTPEKLLCRLEDALELTSRLTYEAYIRKLTVHLGDGVNPVAAYLYNLDKDPLDHTVPDIWDTLALRLFGVSDDLSQQMLSRWLIGAVARAMEPGCQMDTCLVIRGKTGTGKTSFLRALFGAHFVTLHSHQKDEELKRLLTQAWGCELGEIETITRAKDVEALKTFLSETSDAYRGIYERTPSKHPRHCVFAGTANSTDILRDETGNRRFWIIDSEDHDIPVGWVRENRDLIWLAAYKMWQQKAAWDFDKTLTAQSEERNQGYHAQSAYTEVLEPVLTRLEDLYKEELMIRASDILVHGLGIPVERHNTGTSRQLAQAMRVLGYEKKAVGKARLSAYRKTGTDAKEVVSAQQILDAKLHVAQTSEADIREKAERMKCREEQKAANSANRATT